MSKNTLDDALDFAGQEAKHWVVDALRGMFHNEGYTLNGNTAESDMEWFARKLYEFDTRYSWNSAEEPKKEHYRRIAQFVIGILHFVGYMC